MKGPSATELFNTTFKREQLEATSNWIQNGQSVLSPSAVNENFNTILNFQSNFNSACGTV